MILLLLACWTKVSGEIPVIKAQKCNDPIVVEDTARQVLQLDVRAGYAHDPIGKEGLAWWTAHSLFPSTLSKTVSVHPEYVRFRFSIPKAKQTEIIAGILDSLRNPIWYPQDIVSLREQLLDSSYLPSQLDTQAAELINTQWLYSGHPYGHSAMGNLQSAQTISSVDIQEFFAQYYTRSSVVLGWAGSPQQSSILEVMQEGLLSLPTHIPRYQTPVSLPPRKERKTLIFHVPELENSMGTLGLVIPNAVASHRWVALAMQEYLCPRADEGIFFAVHNPTVSCVWEGQSSNEVIATIEENILRYEEFFSLSPNDVRKYMLQGVQKRDPLSYSSLLRMSFVDASEIPTEEQCVVALQEMQIHAPQMLLFSPEQKETFVDIEDIFSSSVLFSQYKPFFLAQHRRNHEH